MPRSRAFAALSLGALISAACASSASQQLQHGNSERGVRLLEQYQCAACHRIPGVPGPQGRFGPALTSTGRATYLAGHLPNTPGTLARFIAAPQEIKPGTLMPDMGVSPAEARDMAAYLSGLR
jgi:cytochrome c